MKEIIAISCLLFTPANREDRYDKALHSGVEGIIFDLEDAVAGKDKETARASILKFINHYDKQAVLIALRINSLKTVYGLADIQALLQSIKLPDILVIPKVEYAAELKLLDTLFASKSIGYLPIIETGLGLDNLTEIVTASTRIQGVAFGGADYVADLGCTMTWENLLYARSRLVQGVAGKNLALFDVPYFNLHDNDDNALLAEIKAVKNLGFTGKLAIHPKHIQPIQRVFTPSAAEVTQAKKIITAYENAAGNACEMDGKMVDVPIYQAAKRILGRAKNSLGEP